MYRTTDRLTDDLAPGDIIAFGDGLDMVVQVDHDDPAKYPGSVVRKVWVDQVDTRTLTALPKEPHALAHGFFYSGKDAIHAIIDNDPEPTWTF